MKKGISPLIAAVLLIAFTMAIAGLFSQWAPQLIQESQRDTTNSSDELRKCSQVLLQINDADGSEAVVQQTYGEEVAGNISVTWQYSDGTIVQQFDEITNTRGTVTVSSGDSGDIDEVRAEAVNCQGSPATTYP